MKFFIIYILNILFLSSPNLGSENPNPQKNMASIKKATRFEKHCNPSKKREMDTPLLEVENLKLANLEDLIEKGVDANIFGNFSLSEKQRFIEFPPLFAAVISGHIPVIEILVGKCQIVKTEDRRRDS